MFKFVLIALVLSCVLCDLETPPDLAARGFEKPDVDDVPVIALDLKDFINNIKHDSKDFLKNLPTLKGDKLIRDSSKFITKALIELKRTIRRDLEPLPLPKLRQQIKTVVKGHVELTHGQLHNLSVISSPKQVVISKKSPDVTEISLLVHFKEVPFDFNYGAKVMNIGPTGQITGTIKNYKAIIKVEVNTKKKRVESAQLKTINRGKSEFEFGGHDLLDVVLNVLSSAVSFLIDYVVEFMIDTFVKKEMGNFVVQINKALEILEKGDI